MQAFTVDHKSLPEQKHKDLKNLRTEINQRKEGFAKIDEEVSTTLNYANETKAKTFHEHFYQLTTTRNKKCRQMGRNS